MGIFNVSKIDNDDDLPDDEEDDPLWDGDILDV
jgi:hypothetical protein